MMEGYPIDVNLVFNTLSAACGDNNSSVIQQTAMKSLQTFENIKGFVNALTQVLAIEFDHKLDLKSNCRLLAVITLKNVVSRCWKTRGSFVYLIEDSEKKQLKDFILTRCMCLEKDKRVLSQLTVLVAQIAKLDWPTVWPELLPSLFEFIQIDKRYDTSFSSTATATATTTKNDSLVYFDSVLSELSSKGIPSARKSFNDSALHMFPYILNKWADLSTKLLVILQSVSTGSTTNDLNVANNIAEVLLLLTNILEIMIIKLFSIVSTSAEFIDFFRLFMEQQYNFINFLQNLPKKIVEIFLKVLLVFDLENDKGHYTKEIIEKLHGMVKIRQNNLFNDNHGSLYLLIIQIQCITNQLFFIPTTLQKDYPLQMVPFLESYLNISYIKIIENFSKNNNNSDKNNKKFLEISLQLTNSPCISMTLFLSNTLSCRVYTTEINNVAKLKEKLTLRLQLAASSYKEDSSKQVS